MLPINMWTILDRHHEDVEGKHKDFDVFPTTDRPFRYFQLFVKVQNWMGHHGSGSNTLTSLTYLWLWCLIQSNFIAS
jgi:hypothetical protein